MFKVGDRVICVDDTLKYAKERILKGFLRKGSIYTIRKSYISKDDGRTEGVYLDEIISKVHPIYGNEFGFYHWHFRKLWDDRQLKEFNVKNKEKEPVGIL